MGKNRGAAKDATMSSDCFLPVASIRRTLIHVLCALGLAGALMIAFRPPLYAPYQEGNEYAAMASGHDSRLHSYYAGRVLHPWAVHALAQILHRPPDAAVFRLMSDISLVVALAALSIYYALDGCNWSLVFFAATPILIDQYRNYYWADLFYLTVWLVFLLVLRSNIWLSLPLVVALYLTRESTIILVASLVIVGLLQGKKLFVAGSLAAGFAGASLISPRVSSALPNTHGISIWMLDLLKVPFNFALNILGVSLWTNTIASTTPPPARFFVLPAFLRLGDIVQVGYIDWSWTRPAALALFLFSAFGVLPLISFRSLRIGSIKNEPVDQAISRLFGAFMLILTPLTGTTPSRYVLYSAPLFWITSVLWMRNWSWRRVVPLAGLSLAVAWFPVFVRLAGDRRFISSISLLPTRPVQLLMSLTVTLLALQALSRKMELCDNATSNETVHISGGIEG